MTCWTRLWLGCLTNGVFNDQKWLAKVWSQRHTQVGLSANSPEPLPYCCDRFLGGRHGQFLYGYIAVPELQPPRVSMSRRFNGPSAAFDESLSATAYGRTTASVPRQWDARS